MTFTPTQQRILNLLSDKKSHTIEELRELLWDEMSEVIPTVRMHISNLRKKLREEGKEVICQHLIGGTVYRLIELSPHV